MADNTNDCSSDEQNELRLVIPELYEQILGRWGLAPYLGEPDELDLKYCLSMSKFVRGLDIPSLFDDYVPCLSGNTKIKSSEIAILFFVQSLCYETYSQMDMYSFWQCHSCREVLNKPKEWELHPQVRKSYAAFLAKLGCVGIDKFVAEFILRVYSSLIKANIINPGNLKLNIEQLALLQNSDPYTPMLKLGVIDSQDKEFSFPIFSSKFLSQRIKYNNPQDILLVNSDSESTVVLTEEEQENLINNAISDWCYLMGMAQLNTEYIIIDNDGMYPILSKLIEKHKFDLICPCPKDCACYEELNKLTINELEPLSINGIETNIYVSQIVETKYKGRKVKVLLCSSPNRTACAYEYYLALAKEEYRIYSRQIKLLQTKGARHQVELEDLLNDIKSKLHFCRIENIDFVEFKGYQQMVRGRPRKNANKSVVKVKLSSKTNLVICENCIQKASIKRNNEIIMTTDLERQWEAKDLIKLYATHTLIESNKNYIQSSVETRCYREKRIERLFARIALGLCSDFLIKFLGNEVKRYYDENKRTFNY